MPIVSSNENFNVSKEMMIRNSLSSKTNKSSMKDVRSSMEDEQEFKSRFNQQPKKDVLQKENNSEKKVEKDPLMNYPGRALAYSNEFAVALNPISKTLGTMLWIPALMYFGADIYDKYKRGEEGDYAQSSKRAGVQQAVFQGLASCILPIFAVHGGQHVASDLMKKVKGGPKLSADSQMEILNAMENKVNEGLIDKNTSKSDAQEQILKPIKNLFDINSSGLDKKEKKKKFSISDIHFKDTPKMKPEQTEEFINKNIDELLDLKEHILDRNKDTKIKDVSKHVKHYDDLVKKYSNESNGKEKALKETLKKFINKKTLKPNTMKTIGGFVALFALAVPIDHLVENVIIKKAVEPGLKQVEKKANEDPNFLGGMFFKGKNSTQQA